MVGLGGSVYAFGDVPYKGGTNVGDVADIEPTSRATATGSSTHNGTLLRFGDAPNFGDAHTATASRRARRQHVGHADEQRLLDLHRHRTGAPVRGAQFLGDMSAVRLNGPVLGSISTPSGHGYYMVASDGGVFSLRRRGVPRFHGQCRV